MESDISEILLTANDISTRVRELGKQISEDYNGKELVLLGVLKASFVFLADLVRSITIPVTVDFVGISSYRGSTKSTGVINITKGLDDNIENKHVLIVDGIVDTGRTLISSGLIDRMHAGKAASVRVCTLLNKPSRRVIEVQLDYLGFSIPDKFVVGYGLDYKNMYRNLPYIGVLKEEIYRE